jgi:aspartate/methionine/tyrosine aminotransferase
MNKTSRDPLSLFQLRPLKTAKISEISEATASSNTLPEERVNFHIGNPVQDERLFSMYVRMVLGSDETSDCADSTSGEGVGDETHEDLTDAKNIRFLKTLVRKSAPYMPRGGFLRSNPSQLVKNFNEWLEQQQDPLAYDLGQTSGKREVILATGGIIEALRVFFHALSSYLVTQPAKIYLLGATLPEHLLRYTGLEVVELPCPEKAAIDKIEHLIYPESTCPNFILIGKPISEETRRFLRNFCIDKPLMFIEANDAPNYTSLAREAKLMNRVIRFMTPGIFSRELKNLATVFVAGNADYLNILESIHFQLKGTPSASEVEYLAYILERITESRSKKGDSDLEAIDSPRVGDLGLEDDQRLHYPSHVIEGKIAGIIRTQQSLLESTVATLERHAGRVAAKLNALPLSKTIDSFANRSSLELLSDLVDHPSSNEWLVELSNNFLNAFLKHHPEYSFDNCVVVSGSARTVLGILGFHCGIDEAIVPDLGWTYEHCFPSLKAVPLTPVFGLDAEAMIDTIKTKIEGDPFWQTHGAVVINNPHNATGQVFDENELKKLIQWLLERNITVIDDLAYQNVKPTDAVVKIKTIRQIALELVRNGVIGREAANNVLTVHSLSKTDCLAGARLAVVEIKNRTILQKFSAINATIRRNSAAILLAYLFYRNETGAAHAYWNLRNSIFFERSNALIDAHHQLPAERNPFEIDIIPPKGSMYPLMVVRKLPAGLSLDWIASRLAHQGIGMIPLGTFAHTEEGFETGRKTFRLTLGGTDGAEILSRKTRRVLIDLNRLIGEESANYRRIEPPFQRGFSKLASSNRDAWNSIAAAVTENCRQLIDSSIRSFKGESKGLRLRDNFIKEFLPQKMEIFRQRFEDRMTIATETANMHSGDQGKELERLLEREFYKDNLERRQQAFRHRLFDRTVHPTQMYSIQTEIVFKGIIYSLIRGRAINRDVILKAARELIDEYLGLNVAITSAGEADELLLDLDTYICGEQTSELQGLTQPPMMLSFWGDWDGSTRPSGQGHLLTASVIIENVMRQSVLLNLLSKKGASVDPHLKYELEHLQDRTYKFTRLLDTIITLTHQLERRYRSVLPFHETPGTLRRVGMALHVASDPVTSLWHHNDRLERKMLHLRTSRKNGLEYYFSLNKQLRKQLYELIPFITSHVNDLEITMEAALFRDLLKRFTITPRITQKLITSHDPFAIDTTVHNIHEINEIAGTYGNPGIVTALQISMSSNPSALIALDRKMTSKREHVLRDKHTCDLPQIWLVPLLEDVDSVGNVEKYLSKVWDYSHQTRKMGQPTRERFAELICEIFIAGSDLSQQAGQTAGAAMYKRAKFQIVRWLAEQGLATEVRIKLGSGEPMQRQGSYYADVSGKRAFVSVNNSVELLKQYLSESTRKSTDYATTPLMGIFSGGDLRTFQSAVSEQLRHLSIVDLVKTLYHIRLSQQNYRKELVRASEETIESRMQAKKRGEQEIERLTIGTTDRVFDELLQTFTANFRQIVYGSDEDVVGIHLISYFIARTTPPLRDRPTIRPRHDGNGDRGQKILEKIAETIPFSRYGSLLRAIAHNQAQTAVLGINQLTCGLFRTLDAFSWKGKSEGETRSLISEKILPYLPVYEILHSLRIYHDVDLSYLGKIERAFPAGNTAFSALREDIDAMNKYIGLFQQELLRRHGLETADFFEGDKFNPALLPTLRPDLAVLLQSDLFNTDIESVVGQHPGIDTQWRRETDLLLRIPLEIREWRLKAWELLERPVFQRVQSFAELAVSLNSLSSKMKSVELPASMKGIKLSPDLSNFFRTARADDEMRQFLAAATEYLTSASEGMVEVPITIIRALKEVEHIAKIEELALSEEDQNLLRFYLLQIARLANENG